MHFLPKITSTLEHPVFWLFLKIQGGLTTQKNRLKLLFQVV